jgi:hypothetical protein
MADVTDRRSRQSLHGIRFLRLLYRPIYRGKDPIKKALAVLTAGVVYTSVCRANVTMRAQQTAWTARISISCTGTLARSGFQGVWYGRVRSSNFEF